MELVNDRNRTSNFFDYNQALNIRGILKNTVFPAFVDNLDAPKSIWVKDRYFQFLCAREESFVEDFNNEIEDEFFGFSGANEVVLDFYMKNHLIQWKNTCTQLHYVSERFKDVTPLESLKLEDAKYIDENYEYQNDDSLEKIKEAIKNRPTSCLRIDGIIVSFVLLHEDDSIGYMFTLPEYRGKGYAYELTKDIVNKVIDSGRLPYIQIVKGNLKSIALAKKSGFIEHGDVHWFGVMNIGKSVQECANKYFELYNEKPLSISIKTNIKLKYDILDVKVTEDHFEYGGYSYSYRSKKEEEVYYINVDEIPEDVLISGLYLLAKEDYEIVMLNQSIQHLCFLRID